MRTIMVVSFRSVAISIAKRIPCFVRDDDVAQEVNIVFRQPDDRSAVIEIQRPGNIAVAVATDLYSGPAISQ
jgi:hypothetical protein